MAQMPHASSVSRGKTKT